MPTLRFLNLDLDVSSCSVANPQRAEDGGPNREGEETEEAPGWILETQQESCN
jgi:hypothetical protein